MIMITHDVMTKPSNHLTMHITLDYQIAKPHINQHYHCSI